MKLIMTIVLALALSNQVWGDHGKKRENTLDDGGLVTSKSFKTNYFVYRSIGGESYVKGKKKKRKWWCVWLCKRRVNKDADRIEIQNTYYSEVSAGIFEALERGPKVCTNTNSCKQKEWAVGVVKTTFPGTGNALLPIDGVITSHTIEVDGRTIRATTSAGKHPGAGPIIVE